MSRLAVPGYTKIFIVHGHDEAVLQTLARFFEKLGLQAIVLMEQSDMGLTIIEKFEAFAGEVGFAVMLLIPDDVGVASGKDQADRRDRTFCSNLATSLASSVVVGKAKLVMEMEAAQLDFNANMMWGLHRYLRIHQTARKRGFKIIEWPRAMENRYQRIWSRIIAIGRARCTGDIDLAEINKLFGWGDAA